MSRQEHFQTGAEQDDRYQGESDSVYRKRKKAEAAMAAHEAKYPRPANYDPFAGIPSSMDDAW